MKIGAYVFVFFGGVCVFAFLYVRAVLPETKGTLSGNLSS